MQPSENRQFNAYLRFIRISPHKVRLVANMVRGMDCNAAVAALQYTHNRGAYFLSRLLKSAMANVNSFNLEHNTEFDVEQMYISELRVDDGPRLKRWRSAPMGRGVPIMHRTSHITVGIKQRVQVEQVETPADADTTNTKK